MDKFVNNRIKSSQHYEFGLHQTLDHFFGRPRMAKMFKKQRQRYFRALKETIVKNGKGQIVQVDRRKDLSLEEFREKYQKPGIPVVFEGKAKDWGCCKKWSLDYFNELHGDDEVVLFDQKNAQGPYYQLTLTDVIEDIKKGGNKYYRFYPLLQRHPEHLLDIDYKWLRERRQNFKIMEAFQVFLGGAGTDTPLHNANQGNLFVQAYGRKHWRLYSNKNTPVVDPDPTRNLYRNAPNKVDGKPFDPFNPDYGKPYDLFEFTDSYETILEPGDIFWNPPFMWHAVRNLTDSIGLGYRWTAPLHAFKLSPLYTMLDLFSTKPPIWKCYKMYEEDPNLMFLAEFDKLKEHERLKKEGVKGAIYST